MRFRKGHKGLIIALLIIALGVVFWSFHSLERSKGHLGFKSLTSQEKVVHEKSDRLSHDIVKTKVGTEQASGTPHKTDEGLATVESITKDRQYFVALSIGDLWELYTQNSGANTEIRMMAAKWLSEKLDQSANGSREVQLHIAAKLLDEAGDEGERLGLARILGESNTPEGLTTLVAAVLSTRNLALQNSIIEQLGRMGSRRDREQVAAMSEAVVSAWERISQQTESHPSLPSVVFGLLAKLGEPNGINILRNEAIKGGATLAEFDNKSDDVSFAAMNSSLQVRGPQSVPLLTSALQKSNPTSTEFVWSGQALASMGRPEATAALIEWAKIAPDSCADMAAAWIGGVRDSRSHTLVRELAASGGQEQFASNQVKEAVLTSAERLTRQ